MRSRFFGAGSYDDEDDEEDYDMSGFVGDQTPPKPPIVERARDPQPPTSSATDDAEPIGASYAGPTNRVRTNPAASINYAPNFVQDTTFEKAGYLQPFNPLWASDNTMMPKVTVFLKTAGLSVAMITAFPALRKKVSGKTGAAFTMGTYAYLSQSLGYNHGTLEKVLGPRHFMIEHPSKLLFQGVLAYSAFKVIQKRL